MRCDFYAEYFLIWKFLLKHNDVTMAMIYLILDLFFTLKVAIYNKYFVAQNSISLRII